jgi:hypothetical protein
MTLGDYRRFAVFAYGVNSKATEYLDCKIKESPNGNDERVLADEVQMLVLLSGLAEQD